VLSIKPRLNRVLHAEHSTATTLYHVQLVVMCQVLPCRVLSCSADVTCHHCVLYVHVVVLCQESKVKLRDEIAAHMAAHQQQIKAARARVNRDELLQLGMQFAARLQAPAPPAAQVGDGGWGCCVP
jgi:hypothetical protein